MRDCTYNLLHSHCILVYFALEYSTHQSYKARNAFPASNVYTDPGVDDGGLLVYWERRMEAGPGLAAAGVRRWLLMDNPSVQDRIGAVERTTR
jgi:hypothetical protein